MKKIFRKKIPISPIYSYMALGTLAVVGAVIFFFWGIIGLWPKPHPRSIHQLAVVDTQALSAHYAREWSQAHPKSQGRNHKPSPRQIQNLSEKLKDDLEAFAKSHNLVLLPKGVVMGGTLPDYTPNIVNQQRIDPGTQPSQPLSLSELPQPRGDIYP